MKIPRSLLLIFLVGSFAACLAEEEAPLPTAGVYVGTEEQEEEQEAVASKLAETGQAGNAAVAAAAEEAADALEEEAAQVEEEQERLEEEEGQVEDAHETGSSEGEEANNNVAAASAAPAETEAEAEAADAQEEPGFEPEENEGVPAAAAADRALGGEEDGDLESATWRRRAAGRLDGFVDGWRGNGEGNPFRGALGSYDALLKEHFLKMSFAQVIKFAISNLTPIDANVHDRKQTRLFLDAPSVAQTFLSAGSTATCGHAP